MLVAATWFASPPTGPASDTVVEPSPAIESAPRVLVIADEADASDEVELVLGAHLRAASLEPTFTRARDPEGRFTDAVVELEGDGALGAVLWLERGADGWVVHGCGPGGRPHVRALGSESPATASVLEGLGHVAASMATSLASRGGPASDLEASTEHEEQPGLELAEPAPEPESAEMDPRVEGPRPRSNRDELGTDGGRWTHAPRRDAFTLTLGWSGNPLRRGAFQNAAELGIGWTFTNGVYLGVGAGMTGPVRLEDGDRSSVMVRRPTHVAAGYRFVFGERLDLDLTARVGADWMTIVSRSTAGRADRAFVPSPFVGSSASVGVWAGGPISLRLRAAVEVPLVRQPLVQLPPARFILGFEAQIGVNRVAADDG